MTQERNTGERPLTARSVLASVLLGTRPPELSGQRLVRTAELFGFTEGTTRVALSRMVAAGELQTYDGSYGLTGPLAERHTRQETSRHPTSSSWNGDWLLAVAVAPGGRPPTERIALRKKMARARMATWREGLWARPDNLGVPNPRTDDGCTWLVTRLADASRHRDADAALARTLWDLNAWAKRARELTAQMTASIGDLEAGRTDSLAPCFVIAAAVVRHIQADPLLPEELLAKRWPGGALRADYDRYESAYQRLLRSWLRGPTG